MAYYICNAIEYVNSKERIDTPATYNTMDGSHKHVVEWKELTQKNAYCIIPLIYDSNLEKLTYSVWSHESVYFLGDE